MAPSTEANGDSDVNFELSGSVKHSPDKAEGGDEDLEFELPRSLKRPPDESEGEQQDSKKSEDSLSLTRSLVRAGSEYSYITEWEHESSVTCPLLEEKKQRQRTGLVSLLL